MSKQITSTIMMVRPINFRFNEETAKNNYYQKVLDGLDSAKANEQAIAEFDTFVEKLRDHGVDVVVFQDDEFPSTPDSIFPNNWVSFHSDGRIATYPMYAENRRGERREEMFELLADDFGFHVEMIEDFSGFESEGIFLEGTGSMILDRENRIAYAAISMRTDIHCAGDVLRKVRLRIRCLYGKSDRQRRAIADLPHQRDDVSGWQFQCNLSELHRRQNGEKRCA